MTRRLISIFFLLVIFFNGGLEMYVSALAAERAGIRIIPQWLRLPSELCVPSYYADQKLRECHCPRSGRVAGAPDGVPAFKSRRGPSVPMGASVFPVPLSLTFKFLPGDHVLEPSRARFLMETWSQYVACCMESLLPSPEVPPPRG